MLSDDRSAQFQAHWPLVLFILNRSFGTYRGEGYWEDLMQVGAIGLLKAIDRFDPTRGVRFGSFAGPWIHGEISHYLRDKVQTVRSRSVRVKTLSLDRKIGDDETASHLDTVASYHDPDREWLELNWLIDSAPRSEDVQCRGVSQAFLHEHVREILLSLASGATKVEIAQRYGVAPSSITKFMKSLQPFFAHVLDRPHPSPLLAKERRSED